MTVAVVGVDGGGVKVEYVLSRWLMARVMIMVLVGMMVLMVFITVVFYKSSVCCGILQCSVYSICGIFF